MSRGENGRTVSPRLVDATLRDGRVSIDGETRAASLTVKPTQPVPLGEHEPAARLRITDGDELEVDVSLKPADVAAIRDVLDEIGAAETFDGP